MTSNNTNNEKHWTAESDENFWFAVVLDCLFQLENRMAELGMNYAEFSERVGLSEDEIERLFNEDSDEIPMTTLVKWAKALGMKLTLVAYDDGDVKVGSEDNARCGPVNPEIFAHCWKIMGKPRNVWDIRKKGWKGSVIKFLYSTCRFLRI